jgi:2-polyprenyl-3-methyl-5-hydroxy-6-metoxy-1,4-benzoquinol methylase
LIKYFKIWKDRRNESAFYKKLFVDNPHWNKKNPNEEEALRWEIIKKFLTKIKCSESELKILDVGCGRGWLTKLLSNYGIVLGIEPNKAVVKHAKRLFPELTFICGQLDHMFKDGVELDTFDILVCSEVIEHIPDVNKYEFVYRLNKLVKKNGFLILTTPRKEVIKEWNKYITPNQPTEDWLSEDETSALFLENSFQKIDLQRFSLQPSPDSPSFEIYQLWLFQKN